MRGDKTFSIQSYVGLLDKGQENRSSTLDRVLDEGDAVLFVYKKIKNKITPEINAKVDCTYEAKDV